MSDFDSGAPLPPVDSAVGLLVANEGAAHDTVSDNLLAILLTLWSSFSAFYTGSSVLALGQRMAEFVFAAQRQSARITESHLRLQIQRMGFELPAGTIVDLPTDLRLGAETADVYQRPVREVRYLESTDIPRDEAVETARERLEKLALTDLQLARAVAAQQVLYRFPEATGWRRVIHPELGNVCGLCIAASDRIYQRINRLDIHPGCKCTVLPVVGGIDPGGQLNAEDLSRLYEAAGGTGSRQLAAIRVEIQHNGELGPILTPAQVEMRGPAQVKEQLSDRAASLRRAQLERQIRDLRSREQISQWHQDRLEQLEELLEAA